MIGLTGQSGGIAVPVKSDYSRIMEDIQAKIRSGEYSVGSRLPSTNELAKHYAVSPGTVRRAIERLQLLGVLEGQQGKAVFVAASGAKE